MKSLGFPIALALVCATANAQPLESAPADASTSLPVALTSHLVGADDYPIASVRAGEMGVVGVKFVVRENGLADNCVVTRTSRKPRLDAAACAFVMKRWKFRPAIKDGQPVAFEMMSDVNFTFQRVR